jgi:type IV pilus assembly protein PilV
MIKPLQTGFSLVEVLIALFVLALGVIGVAGMQLTAMRTSQQSAFQTTAVELAAEMADKMRTNDPQMKLSNGGNPFLNVDYQSQSGAPASAGATCYGGGANCSAQELAAFDIEEWEKRIKASLPTSRAKICRDGRPWDSAAKSLTWDCDSSSGSIVIKIGWRAKNPDGSFAVKPGASFPPIVALTVMPYTR